MKSIPAAASKWPGMWQRALGYLDATLLSPRGSKIAFGVLVGLGLLWWAVSLLSLARGPGSTPKAREYRVTVRGAVARSPEVPSGWEGLAARVLLPEVPMGQDFPELRPDADGSFTCEVTVESEVEPSSVEVRLARPGCEPVTHAGIRLRPWPDGSLVADLPPSTLAPVTPQEPALRAPDRPPPTRVPPPYGSDQKAPLNPYADVPEPDRR